MDEHATNDRWPTSTKLRLMAGDGALTAIFEPSLSGQQRDQLLNIAQSDNRTANELARRITGAARRWGVGVELCAC